MSTESPRTPSPIINPNTTGASRPLPFDRPGTPGRESHEREAAIERGRALQSHSTEPLCAPELDGLNSNLLYTLVAENVRDYAIFLMDVQGIIRCWGEGARLMKWWTKSQAEGAHLRMLYPDGGSEDGTAEAHLRDAAHTGEYTGEGHRIRSDGSTFWAYVTLTALRNTDGTLVGFTKVTRDFSARRAVESALQQERHTSDQSLEATRLKQMIASVSHELRTPLNAIVGSISLLERHVGESGPERVHVERLQRNSRHLLTLLDDVLALSRADSGHMALLPSVGRLGPVIDEALADVSPQAATQSVTVINSVSGGAGDLPYWGDEGRVRQILVNLLTNAIKFTDAGGRVTISGGTGERVTGATLEGTGPWLYVRVEDTGRGIPAERLEVIFEPFQQTDVTDQDRGTGLGLSISRQLARLMGGDITVQSEVGVGSTFTVWLPITPAEPIPR
jgi:PAS domain S-box-containing protein